jgi:hypothetical protein
VFAKLVQLDQPISAFLAYLQSLDDPIIEGSHSFPAAEYLQSLIIAALE